MRKNENIFLYFQYLYKAIETESTEGSEVKERIALYIVWLIVWLIKWTNIATVGSDVRELRDIDLIL